jgi:hypothetical protein
MVLGGISNTQDQESGVDPAVGVILAVLGLASIVGGIYLLKRASATGDTFKRSLAMTPFFLLVLLIALGGIGMAIRSNESSPPTDAFGYTEAERRAFMDGCGQGQRCECMWRRLETSVTPDQMRDAERQYMSTGTWPPDVEGVLRSAAASCL